MTYYGDYYNLILRKLIGIIASSPFAEDSYHAVNTRMWLIKFYSDASEAAYIAALSCGLDAAVDVDVRSGHSGDAFKLALLRKTNLVNKIIKEFGTPDPFNDRVCSLISDMYSASSTADVGDDRELNALRDARVISFFDVVLPFYCERYSESDITHWCTTEYARLSPAGRKAMESFYFPNIMANRILKGVRIAPIELGGSLGARNEEITSVA